MFGKKGGGLFPAKSSVHSVMMRTLWPRGKGSVLRDHFIKTHERSRELPPAPKPPKPPKPWR